MTWIICAFLAAILWGASYVAYEQILGTVSSASALMYSAIGSIAIYLVYSLYTKTLQSDTRIIFAGGRETWIMIGIVFLTTAANLLLLLSIKDKNATLAGLIEISYPLFTALFAWLLFKDHQMNLGAALGAILIFSGTACIAYSNYGQ